MEETKYIYYARLIARYIEGGLSDEEVNELEKWKSQSAENTALFERIIENENRLLNFDQLKSVEVKEAWKVVRDEIAGKKTNLFVRMARYAAVFLLLIIGASSVYYVVTEIQDENKHNNMIDPGSPKATLILSDGAKFDLENKQNKLLEDKGGVVVENENFTVNYNNRLKNSQTIAGGLFHTIDVPKSGEYRLVLSDSSVVYLNSMTTLKYPVNFTGDSREVELIKGEAFFEVTKDKSHPFIVKTPDVRLKVLGTSFNVSAFNDDKNSYITLETGSLEVANMNNSKDIQLLEPNQQAIIESGTNTPMLVSDVDASIYSSWRNGTIVFKNETLEEMMKNLARWYNIEVFFEKESLKHVRFSTNIDKYNEIEPILELLQLTNKVKIKTDNNYMLISD